MLSPGLCHDADAAEEVAQAALSKAVLKLATYKRRSGAVYLAVLHVCRRRNQRLCYVRHQRTPQTTPLVEDVPQVPAPPWNHMAALNPDAPDEGLRRRELARLVQVTLDCLPQRYGDALEWEYHPGVARYRNRRPVERQPEGSGVTVDARPEDAFREGFRAVYAGAEVWER